MYIYFLIVKFEWKYMKINNFICDSFINDLNIQIINFIHGNK